MADQNVTLTPEEMKRLLRASDEYFSGGASPVSCDACDAPIIFRKINDYAYEHSCSCGKYNGVMRT
jgi:hypothetical protein